MSVRLEIRKSEEILNDAKLAYDLYLNSKSKTLGIGYLIAKNSAEKYAKKPNSILLVKYGLGFFIGYFGDLIHGEFREHDQGELNG